METKGGAAGGGYSQGNFLQIFYDRFYQNRFNYNFEM